MHSNLFRRRRETISFVMLMYNVYICVWGCSYRLRPSTFPGERVSQINKNQIKIIIIKHQKTYWPETYMCLTPIPLTTKPLGCSLYFISAL